MLQNKYQKILSFYDDSGNITNAAMESQVFSLVRVSNIITITYNPTLHLHYILNIIGLQIKENISNNVT